MKNIIIKVTKSNGIIDLPPTKVIGRNKENLQTKLIFQFLDEFVDGQARLEYEVDYEKHYVILDKVGETYEIPIKNIMLIADKIEMQLVVTEHEIEEGIPVFKSHIFHLFCDPSLNAVTIAPEGFEDWITRGDAKLNLMDEALLQVDNLDIVVERVENGIELTITKKDGTEETLMLYDGEDGAPGEDGIDGLNATINGVNALMINATDGIELSQEGASATIKADNSIARKTDLPTKVSDLTNDSDFQTGTDVSNAIATETTNRQNADNNLQEQIDAITSASDVVDVVGTYAELQAYDTQHLKDNDIIKVLVDETKQGAISYYRWNDTTEEFSYVGSQGPFYTKSESDGLLNNKVDKITGKGLSTNDYTTEEKNKLAGLSNYDDTQIRGLIDNKVDKVTGKGLSTNDYTTEEKNKLDGIESNAEVNNVDDVKVNGTSVVDNKIANIDLTPYATDVELDNIVSKTAASTTNAGDILTIDDALEYRASANVDGNYEQETTSGKNLFDNINLNQKYGDGVDIISIPTGVRATSTVAGTFRVSGLLTIDLNQYKNKTLYVSSHIKTSTTNTAYIRTVLCDSNGENRSIMAGSNQITGEGNLNFSFIVPDSFTEDVHYLMVQFASTTGASTVGMYVDYTNVQLEEGTTPTSYEPYTGGQPSPSPDYPQEIEVIDELGIKVTGKNLFDGEGEFISVNGGYKVSFEDDTIKVNSANLNITSAINQIINVLPNTNYIISGNIESGSSTRRIAVEFRNDSSSSWENYTTIATNIGSFSQTINTGTHLQIRILFYCWTSQVSEAIDAVFSNIMVSTIGGTYEPYKSKTTTIDLQGNFIGKLPNGVKDELSIDKWGNVSLLKKVGKVVFDGSESWSINGSTDLIGEYATTAVSDSKKYGLYNLFSNMFNSESTERFYGNNNNAKIFIRLLITRVPLNVNDFKSWLSTHNTEVYYELATPQTINLGKIENLSTYKGVNNIELVTNLGSTFEIEYAQDLQKAIQQLLNSL